MPTGGCCGSSCLPRTPAFGGLRPLSHQLNPTSQREPGPWRNGRGGNQVSEEFWRQICLSQQLRKKAWRGSRRKDQSPLPHVSWDSVLCLAPPQFRPWLHEQERPQRPLALLPNHPFLADFRRQTLHWVLMRVRGQDGCGSTLRQVFWAAATRKICASWVGCYRMCTKVGGSTD